MENTANTEQQPTTNTPSAPARMGLTLTITDLFVIALIVGALGYLTSVLSIKAMIKAMPGA